MLIMFPCRQPPKHGLEFLKRLHANTGPTTVNMNARFLHLQWRCPPVVVLHHAAVQRVASLLQLSRPSPPSNQGCHKCVRRVACHWLYSTQFTASSPCW